MISRLLERVAAKKDPGAPEPPKPEPGDNLLNGPKRPCGCELCNGGEMPVDPR